MMQQLCTPATARQTNQVKLNEHLDKIDDFLSNNRLSMNRTKTTINEIMIKQKRARLSGQPPTLTTIDNKGELKIITVDKSTSLLGGNIGDNLSWNQHLETGEKAALPKIRKQLEALKLLSQQLPFKSRLNLANGLLISKICYLLPVWGGAPPPSILRKVQIVMNKVARFIMKANKWTKIITLMEHCNWLLNGELADYMSLIAMWNYVYNNSPESLADSITIDDRKLLTTNPPRLQTISSGFRHRTIAVWNTLPETIRENSSRKSFKKQTRQWIVEQRTRLQDRNPG